MTKSRVAQKRFVPGTSRNTRSAHTLLLQMAKEAKELADQAGRISELRKAKGHEEGRRVPQPEVADAVGVTLRAYQAWEGGASDIDPKNLKALADYFGVTPDFIEYGAQTRGRTPAPFASADALATLQQIAGQVNELHALLLGDEAHDEGVVAGIAARLLQTDESPQPQVAAQPKTPPAARRRKSA